MLRLPYFVRFILFFLGLIALPGISLAQNQTISYGQTLSSDLSTGEQDVWIFAGNPDDTFRLDITTTDTLEIRVEILTPSGASAGFEETKSNREITYLSNYLWEDGPHRIVVDYLRGAGSYTLSLWDSNLYPPPSPTISPLDMDTLQMLYNPFPLEYDLPTSGDTTDILIQSWIFMAEAGDEITITVESDVIDPNVEFINGTVQGSQPYSSADGARETVFLTQFIESSGPYVIRVSDSYANDTGTYTITLERSASGVLPASTPTSSMPESQSFGLGATDTWQNMSFSYPDGWVVSEDENLGTLTIANVDEVSEEAILNDGAYSFTIFDPTAVDQTFDVPINDIAELIKLRQDFYAASMDGAIAEEPIFVSLNDRTALAFGYTTPDFKGIEIAIELNGEIYWIVGYAAADQFDNFEPVIWAIVDSFITGNALVPHICDPDNRYISSERLDEPFFEDMLIFPLEGTIPPGTRIQASLVDAEDFTDFLNLAVFVKWDDGSLEYEEITFSTVPLDFTFEDEYVPLGYFFWIWDDTLDSATLDVQCVGEAGITFSATAVPVESTATLPSLPETAVPVESTSTLPAPPTTPAIVQCPGAPISRMIVGEVGRTTFTVGGTNRATRIRLNATTNSSELGRIPAGTEMMVLDGPICAEGYAWWQVDYNGIVGWAAEGTIDDYWLEPILVASNTPSASSLVCQVRSSIDVNMHMGPGTNFDQVGQLFAGNVQLVIAQSTNASGFIWYQLANTFWVREDVVELEGDCQNLPTVP